MNNFIKKSISIFKSFIPFFIYFFISIFFSILINDFQNRNLLLILSEIVTLLALYFYFRKDIKKDFIDFDNNYKKYLSLGIKVYLLGFILMVLSNYIINSFFIDTKANNQVVNELILFKYPLYSVIGMILFGPFIEELTFRLGFKKELNNKYLYYGLSILLFAGIHTINGISSYTELLFFIPYGCMATAFAYILDKTNNIFTTTVIHTLHNAFTITIIILQSMIGGY